MKMKKKKKKATNDAMSKFCSSLSPYLTPPPFLVVATRNGACEYLKRSIATPTAPIKAFNVRVGGGAGGGGGRGGGKANRTCNLQHKT